MGGAIDITDGEGGGVGGRDGDIHYPMAWGCIYMLRWYMWRDEDGKVG